MRRPCIVPGCPETAIVGARGRCHRHRQTTSERGYGPDHQAARHALARTLPAPCAYGCGRILPNDDPRWVAAHEVDGDPRSRRVAACHWCNERAKHGRASLAGGGVGSRRAQPPLSPDPRPLLAFSTGLGHREGSD